MSGIFFTQCQKSPTPFFEKKWEIPDSKWADEDYLIAEFSVEEGQDSLGLYLQYVVDDGYGYQNIYTQYKMIFPDTKQFEKVSSQEFLTKEGYFNGDKKRGQWTTIEYPILENLTFTHPGEYNFSISPYMRVDTVTHIREVRFIIRE